MELAQQYYCHCLIHFFGSIRLYCCTLWWLIKCKDLERVQLKLCTSLIGVKNTCTAAIYGELGRLLIFIFCLSFCLFIYRLVSIIKYCLQLNVTENIILKILYHYKCVSNAKQLLHNYGFTYDFENVNTLCHKDFLRHIK